MSSTKAEILQAFQSKTARNTPPKPVEAFGTTLFLHKLTLKELDEANNAGLEAESGKMDFLKWQIALFMLAARDAQGELVFERTIENLLMFEESVSEVGELLQENFHFQGIGGSSVHAGKVDSEPTHGDEGSSGSPASSAGSLES